MKTEARTGGAIEESYYDNGSDIEDPILQRSLRPDDSPWFHVTAENGPENGPSNFRR